AANRLLWLLEPGSICCHNAVCVILWWCALHSPKNNALSIVVSSTVLPPGPRTTQPRAAIFQLTLVKLRLQRPTGELGNHLFTILATSQGDAPTCQHASTP